MTAAGIEPELGDMMPDVCSLIRLGPRDVTGKPTIVSETTGVKCRWVDSVDMMTFRGDRGSGLSGVLETVGVAYVSWTTALSTGYSLRHDGKVRPVRSVTVYEDEYGDVWVQRIMLGW